MTSSCVASPAAFMEAVRSYAAWLASSRAAVLLAWASIALQEAMRDWADFTSVHMACSLDHSSDREFREVMLRFICPAEEDRMAALCS